MDYTVQDPSGNEHVITGPDGASDSEILQAAQHLLTPGSLESFGRAAVNNLPAGGQLGALGTAALKGEDYSQGMQDFNQKAQEAKAAHPVAYGAGAVTGSLAPLAIPGVGEAIAAAPVASGAALGAANAVGNTDVVKQPGEALKQGLEGAALGAGTGAILPNASKIQEGLDNFANRKTVQDLGIAAGNLGVPGEEIQNMGTMAHELGADTGSLEDRYNTIKEAWHQTGKQLEDLGQGQTLQNPSQFVQTLQDHIQESANTLGYDGNPEIKMYQKALDRIKPNMPYEDLQAIKTQYANRAFDKFGGIKPNGEPAFNIYKAASDAMDSMTQDHPEYTELKKYYSTLSDMKDGIEKQFQKEQAGGVQAKGFGLAGKMGAMVTGGNVPATVGLGAALAPAHPFMAMGALSGLATNPGAMASAARGVSGALPKAIAGAGAGGIDAMVSHFISNPQSYGKFSAPLMQAVQQGGTQGFAATSFVLRQQHPELNQMMLDRASSLGPQDITNETER